MSNIQVTKGPKLWSGTASVVGTMSVIHFIRNHNIPEYDPDTKKGYQRAANQRRVNILAEDLHKKMTDLPTAILVNRRNITEEDLIKEGDEIYLPLPKNKNDPFIIIDGQHRVKALQLLMKEKDADTWGNYQIPFVCLLGAKEHDEMQQFHIVNSNAKSVKTDLTYTLLRQRSFNNNALKNKMIQEGDDWLLDAEKIKDELTKTELWENLIQLANGKATGTIISSSGMVNSLKPALSDGSIFFDLSVEEQVKILDAFWKGIRLIFPDAFKDNPKNYAIQKTVGVYTLHAVLPSVLGKIWKQRKDHTNPEEYKNILEVALNDLHAENTQGEPVEGIEFWVAGKEGAAGQFSSEQGRNVLIKRIKQNLTT